MNMSLHRDHKWHLQFDNSPLLIIQLSASIIYPSRRYLVIINYKWQLGAFPFFGMAVQIGQFLTYTHLMESIPPKSTPIVTGILFFLEGICGYVVSPVFLLIFKDTKVLIITAFIFNILSVSMLWIFGIKESFKFYLARGRYEEANLEVERVMKVNGNSLEQVAEVKYLIGAFEQQFKLQTLSEGTQQVGVEISYKWRNVILMVTCWIASCYSYFMFVFLIKYLPADIYVVDIASGLSSFGFLLQVYLIEKINHQKTQLLSYVLSTLTLLIITLFGHALNIWVYAFVILNLKLFICLSFGTIYVVHLELFDSAFLGTSYGICNVLSRLAIITAPWVAEMENTTTPLCILLGLNMAAVVCTVFLKPKVKTNQ